MTDPRPQAFGMFCVSVAMKAKAGSLHWSGVVALLCCALDVMRHDDDACAAVSAFAQAYEDDPRAAGDALHDWLLDWLPDPEIATRPAEVLAEIEAKKAQPEFDWQKRVDING